MPKFYILDTEEVAGSNPVVPTIYMYYYQQATTLFFLEAPSQFSCFLLFRRIVSVLRHRGFAYLSVAGEPTDRGQALQLIEKKADILAS
jgi:hypothetical protein